MENSPLKLVTATSALTPFDQLKSEFAKDRWDARNIPGLHYAPNTVNYYIRFANVPELFRTAVKDYIRYRLAEGRVAGTLSMCTYHLGVFLDFFLQQYPDVTTLRDLRSRDIDNFIISLKGSLIQRRLKRIDVQVWLHIHALEGFLLYLERTQSPHCALEATPRIIWPHHIGKFPSPKSSGSQGIKYIPQSVLDQLDNHFHLLPSVYIPVVLILRASGWRISDVLCLKLYSCMEKETEKFWLVGDIQKTKVLGHRIPITKEVAAVVLAQITWVKQCYTEAENPQGWLFPASKKANIHNSQRFAQGDPLSSAGVNGALNQLTQRYQIQDEKGTIFHLKSHAFRHTKGVELVNNGMSLVMVQQWMAHVSPEMTLVYAKILDETMRVQWEKTVQHGIVQFNDGKPEFVPGKKLLPMAGTNAFDPKRVREHRQNVKMALGSCLKTTKIVCKFVELPCFHCPAYVLTPDDLPALEVYEQQILERIEVGKQAGNVHWIEVNQKNLDERVHPAMALLKQGHVVAKTDRQEREYTDKEWEQRQQHEKSGNV